MLTEIQALVCHSNFGIPRRQTTGTDFNRVNLLMAVLEKRLGMQIGGCDAYVNLAGGIRITEPAIDLGIVMAIMSSFKNSPVPEGVVAFGEVGLSGEVRAVSMAEQRVREAQKLGFTTCILPQVCLEKMPKISGIRLVGVRSVADAARTRNRIYCDLVVEQIFFRRHFVIFGNRIDAVGREDAVIRKVRRTV